MIVVPVAEVLAAFQDSAHAAEEDGPLQRRCGRLYLLRQGKGALSGWLREIGAMPLDGVPNCAFATRR